MRNKLKCILGAIFIMVVSCNYLYATDAVLKWDASTGDVSGYIIYYGLSQGSYPFSEDVENVTQYSLNDFSLTEGTTYYFVVRAYNASGESGDSNITTYTVPSSGDTTPPIPPEGISGAVVNDGILLQWQANSETDFSEYRVYYGTAIRNYGLPISVSGTEYSLTGLETDVTYYLSVSAVDTSGNESGYSSPEVAVMYTLPDTTAPVLTVTSPTWGENYSIDSDKIDIGGIASDAVGVTSVAWASDKGGFGTATGTDNWSVRGISLVEGPNVITITASDASSNEATDTLTVWYEIPDTTAPIVSITSPTTGTNYDTESDSISLIGIATDDIGTSIVTWSNSRGGAGTASGTASWSASGIALAEGDNVITVIAKDAAGNNSTDVLTVTYTEPIVVEIQTAAVDTQPPKVILTRPDITKSNFVKKNYVNLAGTASDNVGIKEIRWENAQGGTNGTASGTDRWNVLKLPLVKGWNDITITAEDSAGNTTVMKLSFYAVFK